MLLLMLALVMLASCSFRPEVTAVESDKPQTQELVWVQCASYGSDANAFAAKNVSPNTVPVAEESEPDAETPVVAEPEEEPQPFADEELEAMVLVLAGECYDDKELDKRLVCEVILNRVGKAEFGYTVIDVITKPYAFSGYQNQSRAVSENDYAVAEQALRDWYDNGCQPLSEWLFFNAGPNRENVFRTEY